MDQFITKETAIRANLTALEGILYNAIERIDEATQYLTVKGGNTNAAIGAIIDLDQLLETAVNLHKAALFLHRLK
ncbi:hypothetical protein [Tolypothrix sp. VBCCA 56010]|uniref:hypothetical protein n=1 Tax=Tolypothrix sp. VBCCA 56010 TaxID=3137731 RepID=UPI003D7F07DC